MKQLTILSRVYPPKKCFLSEVLYWRAFGRFPEMGWDSDGNDYRFVTENFYADKIPIPSGKELSEEECKYANLPNDPRLNIAAAGSRTALMEEFPASAGKIHRLQVKQEGFIQELDDFSLKDGTLAQEAEKWLPIFEDYVDEFQSEIALDLRKGKLKAYGTEIQDHDYNKLYDIAEEQGKNERELIDEVPAKNWVSREIDWDYSVLKKRDMSFIWIHVDVKEMLKLYPPKMLIKNKDIQSLGGSYAVANSVVHRTFSKSILGGRPPKPWEVFHVEVARRFRDGDMPQKKEAAIAELAEWFIKKTGNKISRSAIGEKLKPYYDELMKKTETP
ncbi:MAG: hypothetical protein COA47_02780 [Robiginitomaculum sp.]|nr:MAG: hypothetical protein COA47_02780 [Robiginitomaculum sp.]